VAEIGQPIFKTPTATVYSILEDTAQQPLLKIMPTLDQTCKMPEQTHNQQ
jgi:hypothetical protein